MSELIELLLGCLGEIMCGAELLDRVWRFCLAFLGSLGLVGLICWTVSNHSVRVVLSAPVVIAGIILGICWQVRSA